MQNKILNIIFIFLVIAVLVWLAFYLAGNRPMPAEDLNLNNNEVSQEEVNRSELFASYIRANIGELSPEPAVLGGSFYVTEVNLLNDNSALVDDEDGHIALRGVIGFDVINEQVVIKSFEIIPEEETSGLRDEDENMDQNICFDQCGNGICEEIVCLGETCPCPETSESCLVDCF